MERTLETKRLKMEIKKDPPDSKFQAWVNHAQMLVEKYPHKDTQWLAQQLAEFLKENDMPASYYRLHRAFIDDVWQVSLHHGRIILPVVVIYVNTKTEAA